MKHNLRNIILLKINLIYYPSFRFRVKGVNRLRIIDSSILPTPISGNPNSVLIAMAERASDLILGRIFN